MPVNSVLVGQQELEAFLLANLPTGITAAKVKLPNVKFTTPNASTWLRATVNPLTTTNTVATGCRQRTRGIFTIEVFSPKAKGTYVAMGIAVELQQTFVNTFTVNVSTYSVDIIPRGEDGDWYHIQVDVNYAHEGTTKP